LELVKKLAHHLSEYLFKSIQSYLSEIPQDFNLSDLTVDESGDVGHQLLIKLQIPNQINQKSTKQLRQRKGGFLEFEQVLESEIKEDDVIIKKTRRKSSYRRTNSVVFSDEIQE
jgi:predicted RNA-binding protein with RPS1 domain